MVQAPKCRFCGEAHFSTQPCFALVTKTPKRKIVEAVRRAVAPTLIGTDSRAKPVAVRLPEVVTAKARWKGTAGTGTLVGVRLQGDLLHRLNRARGAATRPQFIRAILERELAK